jgi:hypothetical protein
VLEHGGTWPFGVVEAIGASSPSSVTDERRVLLSDHRASKNFCEPYGNVERDIGGLPCVPGRRARAILPGNERATWEATSAAGRGSLRSQ